MFVFLMLFFYGGQAQKKWDGEGGDGQWKNPLNWFPNGLPSTTDDVILDHSYYLQPYAVTLLDTATVTINSLTLISTPLHSIQLLIPSLNIVSPALQLNDPNISLSIGYNTVLNNQSGASSGNSIGLNGKMIIQQMGIYRHATLRGNALLISRLVNTETYPDGIFEFDVPGASGYIISVSGRQFPSLKISSSMATKKTYNGSGNGHINVHGNLIISDSSTLNLTINGNLNIRGDLDMRGRLQWQPSLSDTSGRELRFVGDSSMIISCTGIMKMGANFRKLVVASGILNLKTNLSFDQSNHGIQVATRGRLNLDTLAISGPGYFQSDSAAELILASNHGISDTSKGNLRMRSLFIHPRTVHVFTGQLDQISGSRFPDSVGALILNKTSGEMRLSKCIHVIDSIQLLKGNVISHDTALLKLDGNKIGGSTQGFIKGPLNRSGEYAGDWLFPLGDDSLYAPTMISVGFGVTRRSYTLSYYAKSAPMIDSAKKYPVRVIGRNEHWIIHRNMEDTTWRAEDILRLPIGTKSLTGIKGQPNMVHFDTIERKWILMPLKLESSFQNWVSSNPQSWKNGIFTLGEMEPIALSNEKLYLNWSRKGMDIVLRWQHISDAPIQQLFLEYSRENAFSDIVNRLSIPVTPNQLIPQSGLLEGKFVRLKAELEKNGSIVSNIIWIPGGVELKKAYPNPANIKLFLPASNRTYTWLILQDGMKIKRSMNGDGEVNWIDVSDLPRGLHRVLVNTKEKEEYVLFLKN